MAPPGGHSEIAQAGRPSRAGDKAAPPTPLEHEGVKGLNSPKGQEALKTDQQNNVVSAQSMLDGHFGTPTIEGATNSRAAQSKLNELKSSLKSAPDKLPESSAGNSHAVTEIGKGSTAPEKAHEVASGGESAKANGENKTNRPESKAEAIKAGKPKAEAIATKGQEIKQSAKSEGAKLEIAKEELSKPVKRESAKQESVKPELAKVEVAKRETKSGSKPERVKQESVKSELAKSELAKSELAKSELAKSEPAKLASKPELVKAESKGSESTKQESKAATQLEPKVELAKSEQIKTEPTTEPTKTELASKSITLGAQPEDKANPVVSSADQLAVKEPVAAATEVKVTQAVDGTQINAVVKFAPEQANVSKSSVASSEQSNVVQAADSKNVASKADASAVRDAKELSSSPDRQSPKESALANKLDESDKATKSIAQAENDDDRLTIHEQQALLNHLDHQGNASVVTAADTQSQNVNFSPVANQEALGRSASVAPSIEANISHSVNHIVNAHIVRSAEETRIGGRVEELPNNSSSQVAANQTATQTASSGHTNQTTASQGSHSGTAHGAGKTGQGHDPNASGHAGAAAGQGHNQAGNSNDPSSKGHSGVANDPSVNNSGHGHDPSAKDPSAADPSGKPGSVAAGAAGANDPAANQSGHSANDPQGNTVNNSTVVASNSADPTKGQANTTGEAKQPGSVNPGHPGVDASNNGNAQNGVFEILVPVYEDRPMRNLVTLIAEMGIGLAPLHGILSPWGEIGSINNNVVPAITHITNTFDTVTNNNIVTSQVVSVQSNNLSVDNVSVISQHPQDIISSSISGDLISRNFDNVTPSANQIPLVQISTDGTYVSTGNSASVGAGGIISGASEATASNGTLGTGFSTDVAAANNANVPALNQALQGVVDYWTADPNVSNNAAVPNHSQPTANDLDPVPSDNSISYGTAHDSLLDHEQLVSAAQHYHGQGESLENPHTIKHDARTEMANVWSGDQANGHDGPQVGDAWQQNELQNRVDYIANGMWQEPNTKNGSNTNNTSGNKDIKNKGSKTAKTDGLIGQLITLLNDTKGKKGKTARKTYIVKRGDTLESIAAAILMDSRLGVLLYSVNEVQLRKTVALAWQKAKLIEGMVLYLPEDDEVSRFKLALLGRGAKSKNLVGTSNDVADIAGTFEQQLSQGAVQRRQNVERLLGPLNSATENKFDPQTGRASVVVRLGDTIRSIALKHPSLNDVSLWKLLACCNGLSTDVNAKGTPLVILTRGMVLQIPSETEIFKYRNTQAAQIRAHSPRKAISAEVLKVG